MKAYAVRRLVLSDFRCYERLKVATDQRPVVLTGPNGAGKTNLLEALSFLSPGRGLRRARLEDVTRNDAPAGRGWGVAAQVVGPSGGVDVGTGLQTGGDGNGGDRRTVKLDGASSSGPGLARVVHMTWLTPQMDRLFIEGASGRRRFLDRLVYGFDEDHARRLTAYEKAMRDRTRLLREGRVDTSWLGALESAMTEHGVSIAASRRDTVARLNQALHAGLGPFPRADLELNGELESWLSEDPALKVEDRFRNALASSRRRDAEAGRSLTGPHRSDLQVRHVSKDAPAAQCSTGEQKALLIAIVLAEAKLQSLRRDAVPMLLLDEVAAHLDAERRTALFQEILNLGAQAWLTGTDRALFEPLGDNAQFFAVRDGQLAEAG